MFHMMPATQHASHMMPVIVLVIVLAIVLVYAIVPVTAPAIVLVFLEDLDNGKNNQDDFSFE